MKHLIWNNTVAYVPIRDFMNFILMFTIVAMDKVRFGRQAIACHRGPTMDIQVFKALNLDIAFAPGSAMAKHKGYNDQKYSI